MCNVPSPDLDVSRTCTSRATKLRAQRLLWIQSRRHGRRIQCARLHSGVTRPGSLRQSTIDLHFLLSSSPLSRYISRTRSGKMSHHLLMPYLDPVGIRYLWVSRSPTWRQKTRPELCSGRLPELVQAGPTHYLESWTEEYGPIFRIPLLLGMVSIFVYTH